MESNLTLSSIAALFGSMFVLAAIPGVSVLTVSTRSATSGFIHGVFTTIGIVAGDIVFIILAIYGLSVMADMMGNLFVFVKYLGGAYLIWLGIELWRSHSKLTEIEKIKESSLMSSFLAGLFITLGDQKAILFYMGFLPAFLDLSAISVFDTGIIIAVATLAITGAKLSYAYLANKAGMRFKNSKAVKVINALAGSVIVSTGIFLIVKA